MTVSPLWRAFWIAVAGATILSLAILALAPRLALIELLPDQGASWYYWKLPEPTVMSRVTAWGFYILHQLFFWGLIVWAQRNREALKDRRTLHPMNVIGLAGMLGFGLLHYLQTAVWYDGLAQDTSVWSSQLSVVFLLVIVLIIEAPRRGLFFGYGGGWLAGARQVLIRYHGYYFAWAVTYTYWFHPMETTLGHLLGFWYTFLLMIQGALIFTRVHTNRWWTLVLEVTVLVHGTTVAIVGGQEFWPMFFFGFAGIFVVTQMHGLGLSRWLRGAFVAAYAAAVYVIYADRGWENLNEIARIPVIDYVLVILIGGLIVGGLRLASRRRKAGTPAE